MGELDISTQVKLLRFLETRSFERLGSNKPIHVDVRLVCATHRDLADLVAKGAFREDLFYRLHVVPIRLPALRERAEDIPVLLDHYLRHFAKENSTTAPRLTPGGLAALQRYAWPGNVRELRNFCENAVVMRKGGEISEYDLDPKFTGAAAPLISGQSTGTTAAAPVRNTLSKEENEKRLLRSALVEARGNRTKAAELMGISRRTLHRKIAEWPELDTGS